jgi:hypothetical protein
MQQDITVFSNAFEFPHPPVPFQDIFWEISRGWPLSRIFCQKETGLPSKSLDLFRKVKRVESKSLYLVSARKLVFLRKVNSSAAGGGRTAADFSAPARFRD